MARSRTPLRVVEGGASRRDLACFSPKAGVLPSLPLARGRFTPSTGLPRTALCWLRQWIVRLPLLQRSREIRCLSQWGSSKTSQSRFQLISMICLRQANNRSAVSLSILLNFYPNSRFYEVLFRVIQQFFNKFMG